jgi:hypothetical protein
MIVAKAREVLLSECGQAGIGCGVSDATLKGQDFRAQTSWRPKLSTRLIREWKLQRQAVLKVSGDVTFAGRIFDQRNVSGRYGDFLASGNLHFSCAAKGDHVLAARTTMPIGGRTR